MRARTVNEILKFERGLDPIKSMDIGKDHLIKSIPWQLDLSEWPEDYKVVEFISNYRGFPILVYQEEALPGMTDTFQATSTGEYTGMCTSKGSAIRSMKKRIDTVLREFTPKQQKNTYLGN
jgi:hypothetical protein